jgi:hypothetical protein
VQTQLISNATGEYRYHRNSRQRLRFGQAKDNSDWAFVRALYVLFWRHVFTSTQTKRLTVPLRLVIVTFELTRLGWDRLAHLADQLDRALVEADHRPVPRDNQGETAASIRMRMGRGWTDGARA